MGTRGSRWEAKSRDALFTESRILRAPLVDSVMTELSSCQTHRQNPACSFPFRCRIHDIARRSKFRRCVQREGTPRQHSLENGACMKNARAVIARSFGRTLVFGVFWIRIEMLSIEWLFLASSRDHLKKAKAESCFRRYANSVQKLAHVE